MNKQCDIQFILIVTNSYNSTNKAVLVPCAFMSSFRGSLFNVRRAVLHSLRRSPFAWSFAAPFVIRLAIRLVIRCAVRHSPRRFLFIFPHFRYSMFAAPLAIRSSPFANQRAIRHSLRFSMSPDAFHNWRVPSPDIMNENLLTFGEFNHHSIRIIQYTWMNKQCDIQFILIVTNSYNSTNKAVLVPCAFMSSFRGSLFNVRRAVLHSLRRFLFICSNVLYSRFAIQCSPRRSPFAAPFASSFVAPFVICLTVRHSSRHSLRCSPFAGPFPIHFPPFLLFKLHYSMFAAPLSIRSSPFANRRAIRHSPRHSLSFFNVP